MNAARLAGYDGPRDRSAYLPGRHSRYADASTCFGVYYGTFASLFPAVMSDCFGRQHVGVLTGFSFALGSVASALGPMVMGSVADQTSQYTLAFFGGTVVNSLGVLLFTLARPPVRKP